VCSAALEPPAGWRLILGCIFSDETLAELISFSGHDFAE
jgi:hypothetical protein